MGRKVTAEERQWQRIFWAGVALLLFAALSAVFGSGCTLAKGTCPNGPTLYHFNLFRVASVGIIHPESECIIVLSDEEMSEALGATILGGAAVGALLGGAPGAAAGGALGGAFELGKAMLDSRGEGAVLDVADDSVLPGSSESTVESGPVPGGP